MELWAARDGNWTACIYTSDPVWVEDKKRWDMDGLENYGGNFGNLACRGVNPGEKRKLKAFDPINEIVEYEDTLEQKHQRLVDAVLAWSREDNGKDAGLITFLRSEGYIK